MPDNPKGILLCQKNNNSFRWRQKILRDGKPYTFRLRRTDRQTAQQLAINLYRVVCIQYLQEQLTVIDGLRRSRGMNNEAISTRAWTNQLAAPGSTSQAGDLEPENRIPDLTKVYTTLPYGPEILKNVRCVPREPAGFFDVRSPYRPFIVEYLQNEYIETIDWYLRDYIRNKEKPEHLILPVKLGYNVRSKSEVLAADTMYEAGILFHYEEKLELKKETVFPDFYIFFITAEYYYWEHLGAMDSDKYRGNQCTKISDYLDSGYFPGINLIITSETRPNPLTEEMIVQKVRWLKNRCRLRFPDLPPDDSFNLYDLAAHVRAERAQKGRD